MCMDISIVIECDVKKRIEEERIVDVSLCTNDLVTKDVAFSNRLFKAIVRENNGIKEYVKETIRNIIMDMIISVKLEGASNSGVQTFITSLQANRKKLGCVSVILVLDVDGEIVISVMFADEAFGEEVED